MNRSFRFLTILFLLIGTAAVLPSAATAQVAKPGNSSLDGLAFTSPRLNSVEALETVDNVQGVLAPEVANGWAAFRNENGEWNALVDKRTGRVSIAEGAGIPWIPGTGNKLANKAHVDLTSLDGIAHSFMPRVAALLGINPSSLVLNQGRSGQPADYLWFVDYDVVDTASGLPIDGARVVFRVNHGNLIQFGTENLPAGAGSAKAKVKREEALAKAAGYIGGFTAADSFIDSGTLRLVPTANIDNKVGEGFAFGKGRGATPVWQFTFHRDGVMGTWQASVDAATGEVLALKDINDYVSAQATGGIYQNSPTTGSEIVRPMPYTNAGTGVFTNSAGVYNNTAAVSSTLAGQYVKITDTCGAISQASDGSGNIIFGTSTGTDCTTPGHGGAGNTHASREQFYQVNRIKEVVRGWLPSNTWINQQVTVNVNLNQTCNAYWNGSTLNFFKSGGGCRNTGELAGVSLHEFGHGIDQNDGTGTAPEGGTGESYGDTTAVIALHSSCIGPGFLTSNCGGYGDACTSCTGVRDVDFAKHSSGTAATVSNFTQVRCGAGSGPCGKEVHCESYVPSEAIWDFANRDLPNPGTGPAWTTLDRLWYLSRNTATSAFTCTTGGTFTSNGCGTGNWWKTMRAVDDDDGNLSNGTPHGGALFAAFNRHGIACTTDAGASTTFAGCTPPATPAVTATPGNNSVGLSWSGSSGVYDVFRNETGCNAGFTKIANDNGTTSFTDNAVANGLTYFYQIIAQPSGNEACGSVPSTCVSVTPAGTVTPDFTISASPSSISVVQGNSGTSTVTTAALNGFNSAIALSASGAPAGVTVSFSPTSIAAPGNGSSTATFTVGASTALGTYTITITGTGGSLSHNTTVSLTVTSTNPPQQLLGNPGFETGTASPWVATTGVIDNTASQPAHSGSWKAWLDGYGVSHTDTLYQQVTIPAGSTSATLTFWLHIDTAETTTITAFDTLKVQIRNTANTVLSTLATYSNLNKAAGYSQKSFNLLSFAGQTIRVYFLGVEDSSLQTSFVVDDTALNVQ